ncbi:MAG: sulfite exporter TauE/SafE family protein [Desulfobacterales bacterium]
MLSPVSGIEINPFIPSIVAFVVSFFTSMGGVSGAFLMHPFQVSFLGYTAPSVSGTDQVFNVVAIPSGVYRYIREGRMLWPLTLAVIIGTLPGVFIGAWIRIKYLPDPKNFKLFVGIVICCQLSIINSPLLNFLDKNLSNLKCKERGKKSKKNAVAGQCKSYAMNLGCYDPASF